MIDKSQFCGMLGIDASTPNRSMISAAFKHRKLMPLAFSVARHSGTRLGPGSNSWLKRNADRAADYKSLLESIRKSAAAQVIKGPSISETYPDWLERYVGDLDLVVETQQELWAAAREVLGSRPIREATFTPIGSPLKHLVVTLSWEGEDSLLDQDMRVELATAPYMGNHKDVPIRSALPDDRWIRDFLAIAEEGFQQAFRIKDFIDIVILDRTAPDHRLVAAAAAEYFLAPEALELLEATQKHAVLTRLAGAIDLLRQSADLERARRSAAVSDEEEAATTRQRMEAGRPVYGLPLSGPTIRDELQVAQFHRIDGCDIAVTPIGDYLLVPGVYVKQELYDRAIEALKELRSVE